MSQENVEIVRRVYEAVSRGDTTTVLETYAPDITWDFSRSPLVSMLKQTVYRGHDELRSFMRERFEEAWGEFADALEEVIDAGEQVISVVRSGGRGRASGVQVDMTHAGVWTIRDRKVLRVEWFGSRDEALEAAGLSE